MKKIVLSSAFVMTALFGGFNMFAGNDVNTTCQPICNNSCEPVAVCQQQSAPCYDNNVCQAADTVTNQKPYVVQAYDKVKQGTVKVYNKVAEGTVNTYDKVANGTVNTYDKVANGTVNTYDKAKDGTAKAYNAVKDEFKKIF